MKEPLDLNKKRPGPWDKKVTYSVVENLGWDTKDKKQKVVCEISKEDYIKLMEILSKVFNSMNTEWSSLEEAYFGKKEKFESMPPFYYNKKRSDEEQ